MLLMSKDEVELGKHGPSPDPEDPNQAVPIDQLGDHQQAATVANASDGDPGPTRGRKTKKAQAAPFDADKTIKSVVAFQARAGKHGCFCTVLYCRSGLRLIEVKKVFKAVGRRDFCEHTERQGVQPWFRKRAMQIAQHFKTEERCKGILLLDALKMARKSGGK